MSFRKMTRMPENIGCRGGYDTYWRPVPLERTPAREERMRAAKRHDYLVRQARRFKTQQQFPPGLAPVTVMGVDYIYGQVESMGGGLWVGGQGPLRSPRHQIPCEPEGIGPSWWFMELSFRCGNIVKLPPTRKQTDSRQKLDIIVRLLYVRAR